MSDGLIDPADPEYELKVAEWFQSVTNEPRDGDDLPVQITVRQALKIAAIMGAVARGHTGYTDALRDIALFLDCAIADARPVTVTALTAAEAWDRVENWPWPRPGRPREQADS